MRKTIIVLLGIALASPALADLGQVIFGPYNLEGKVPPPPGDNRLLGVEYAWGNFWVTGRGHTTLGENHRIHKFTLDGNYVTSYNQNPVNNPAWGYRDMDADEPAHKIWFGDDNNRFVEYTHNPVDGSIAYSTAYTIPVSPAMTFRAVARNPNTGHFYAANFNSVIVEFDLTPKVWSTFPALGKNWYGFAWNSMTNMLWGWSQDGTPALQANEIDPVTMKLTGKTFQGSSNPALGIAGGADIYPDNRSATGLALVGLSQATPDSIHGYEMNIPEPATLALLVLGGVLLRRR